MAIKTFTTGEVLTAADTNTYLANSGLVYLAGGTLTGTSTNFAGCFSATYENYRIVISKADFAAGFLAFRMLNGTTAYTTAQYYTALMSRNSTQTTYGGDNINGDSYGAFGYNFQSTTGGAFSCSIDFYNPFGTARTFYTCGASAYYAVSPFFAMSAGGGGVNNTTSFDGIQIIGQNGGVVAGNVAIYGYRKA
jgi:hypothetical protein